MGSEFSCIAVRSKPKKNSRTDALSGLSFQVLGETSPDDSDPHIVGFGSPTGWYLIQDRRSTTIPPIRFFAALSQACEVVVVMGNDKINLSSIECWANGAKAWSVTHNYSIDPLNLNERGEVPKQLKAISKRAAEAERVDPGGIDYFFDVPLDLFESHVGYRCDQRHNGQAVDVLSPVPKKSIRSAAVTKAEAVARMDEVLSEFDAAVENARLVGGRKDYIHEYTTVSGPEPRIEGVIRYGIIELRYLIKPNFFAYELFQQLPVGQWVSRYGGQVRHIYRVKKERWEPRGERLQDIIGYRISQVTHFNEEAE